MHLIGLWCHESHVLLDSTKTMLLFCRFALAHEGRMCRRTVTLAFFQEDPSSGSECCDVCSGEDDLKDYQGEMVSIIKAAQEIPGYGEVKVRLAFWALFVLCFPDSQGQVSNSN